MQFIFFVVQCSKKMKLHLRSAPPVGSEEVTQVRVGGINGRHGDDVRQHKCTEGKIIENIKFRKYACNI